MIRVQVTLSEATMRLVGHYMADRAVGKSRAIEALLMDALTNAGYQALEEGSDRDAVKRPQ